MGVDKDVLGFIKDNLVYSESDKGLVWVCSRANNKIKAGSIAGSVNKGYRQIKIFGKWYKVHRLVWLVCTGSWPLGQIDHINRCKLDNRFDNLRDTTNYLNCLNRHKKSLSGYVGVTYDKVNNKWLAQSYLGGVSKNLGRYSTAEEAKDAYITANNYRAKEVN